MKEQHTQSNAFLEGPILPPLVRFALPLILSLLLQGLYGAVDLAVVGRFASTASTAAVAVGSQMMMTITAVVTGLTMGVTVLVGKAVGANTPRQASQVVAAQIRLFLVVTVVLTAAIWLLAPASMSWMHVPADAVDETLAYLRICGSGMVFVAAYNGISGIFRGLGNSRIPLLFVFLACCINVVLDLVLVAGLQMGAAGAAVATVVAQAGSVAFSLVYLRRHPLPFGLYREDFHCPGIQKQILSVGAPIALQDTLVNTSFLIITSIVNRLGLVEAAGIGITEKLFVFLSMVPMAFMSALSTFVAQNMGAGQPLRARQAVSVARRISTAVGVGIFLLTFFGGSLLASLFEDDAAVVAAAAAYFKGSSFEYLMTPSTFCFLGYFNGSERTRFVMLQGLGAAFLVRVPLSYGLSLLPDTGMFTIALAVPVASVVSLVACILYDRHIHRTACSSQGDRQQDGSL